MRGDASPTEGLYYSNARWYDPTLGRFITEDPARADNNWYAYTRNNPLKYVDPTGLIIQEVPSTPHQQDAPETVKLGTGTESIKDVGCVLTGVVRVAEGIGKKEIDLEYANSVAKDKGLFTDKNSLTPENAAKLIGALTGADMKVATFEGAEKDVMAKTESLQASKQDYWVVGRIEAHNSAGTKEYGHQVNINKAAEAGHAQPIVDTSNKNRQTTEGDIHGKEPLFRLVYFWGEGK